jgi:Ca2+-binding RTX toxin-like protein
LFLSLYQEISVNFSLSSIAAQTVVFMDAQVEDYQSLVVAPGVEVVVLSGERDGIEQMTEVLAGRRGVESVHVVSHGRPGGMLVGSGWVEELGRYEGLLRGWGRSLAENASLFVYGCNVAADAAGAAFVRELAEMTGMGVAASRNLTGAEGLGGDWELEVRCGDVCGDVVFGRSVREAYGAVLANVEINNVIVDEGNSGSQTVTFTVSLDVAAAVSVDYRVVENTATLEDGDYSVTGGATGTVTFSGGVTSQTITVQVNGDGKFEADETFTVILSNASGGVITKERGVGVILNDDVRPAFSVGDASVQEGNTGVTSVSLTVSRSGDLSQAASVGYETAGDTAIAGTDFTAKSGVVDFAVNESSKVITLEVSGDTLVEGSESFFVNLLNPINAVVADRQGVVTITNDDAAPLPTLAIGNVSVTEGNSGTVNAVFTVTRSGDTSGISTVLYATANGTATGEDYTAGNGTLTFAAGDVTQTVTVVVSGDTVVEGNENFLVNLSSPTNATIVTGQGTGTITNDDVAPLPPTLAIGNGSVTEGNNGTVNLVFTVTRSGDTSGASTVLYATANGTATSGEDYTAGNGTLSFAVGETTQTVTVVVAGDEVVEGNETVLVNLSGATGATITTAQGTGTITNDDFAAGVIPTISIDDVSVSEGNGGVSAATFTVSLSTPSDKTVTVAYGTVDGTATSGDYTATSGVLTFAPNVLTQTIAVQVRGDLNVESNEGFGVALTNGVNGTIAKERGIGTIVNDDVPPTVSINDVSVTEGDSGTVNAAFTISLNSISGQPITVQYQTVDGTAKVADGDYEAIVPTFLTFDPGQTSKTVNVAVKGDTNFEGNEAFSINLIQSVNATVVKANGVGTIVNNDRQTATPPRPTTPTTPNGGTGGTPTGGTGGRPSGQIVGTPGDDTLNGTNLADVMLGNDGNDVLRGVGGNDLIFGGNDNDQLFGGDGDDVIYGRDGRDKLFGDGGNDELIGGFRNDVLTGGAGQDRFRFNRKQQGIDRVTDFSVVDDTLVFLGRDFKSGLKVGVLQVDQLQLGARALDGSDRLIYDGQTGGLFFDADGSGSGRQVQLARLAKGLSLTVQDFVVI